MVETGTSPSAGGDGQATNTTPDAVGDAVPPTSHPPFSQSPLESHDWTDGLPATAQVALFRSTNWSASLLGPVSRWSVALRLHTFTIFADSRPACLYWGPSKTAIYNEAFAVLAGGAHPMLMGSTFSQAFPELWEDIRGVFEAAERTRLAADVVEIPLFSERNGFVEETYFTGNFTPVRDVDGSIGGFYNATYEITHTKIASRRAAMLNRMIIPTSFHKGKLADYVMPFLEHNQIDITMALLYEADEELVLGNCSLLLRGSIGVPAGHAIALESTDLQSSDGLIPLFREAKSEIMTFPVDQRFNGVEWRGFDEPSTNFSILPLSSAGRLFGFLVLGANSRRAVDEEHNQFMGDIAAKISSIAASIISIEETKRRSERLETELRDSERQIRYMAQNASVGMQHLSTDGNTLWANKQYYAITGHPLPEESQYQFSFIDVYHEEDQMKALDGWRRLIQGQPNVSLELRLKRMFKPLSGDPEPACLLALAFPYVEDGRVKSIMVCTTDISQLKWAESLETRKAAEAGEAKRQQEEFIDIVSHEMRNPLSAIFQCADMIESSFAECKAKGAASYEDLMTVLHSNADAAGTILMCANHQKRIVDDVLTLSKLEYMMLSVSPLPVQPVVLVERAIRMFETDIIAHGIKVTTIAEPSLKEPNFDWILCDPARVAQIFINLLTNAIKFTRGEQKREITVRYRVSFAHPRQKLSDDLAWAPSQRRAEDLTTGFEWGDEEPLYLSISISDTGVGMTAAEIKKLFQRFEQVSSRTSIKYGGSGLGLFISQKLTEKQGGEIGVASEVGRGSTFAFYIRVRRTQPKNADIASRTHLPLPVQPQQGPPRTGLSVANLNNVHVLLVEDNIVNQKVLAKQLSNAGCTVSVANHGVESLDHIRSSNLWHEPQPESSHLDVILMDWEMPIMDGLTCSREIRALQSVGKILRHIDIIAITANARDEQVQSALASGIDSVMSKPFRTSDLLLKMKEMLSAPMPLPAALPNPA